MGPSTSGPAARVRVGLRVRRDEAARDWSVLRSIRGPRQRFRVRRAGGMLADEVSALCYERYRALPRRGKPERGREWTLLAAVVRFEAAGPRGERPGGRPEGSRVCPGGTGQPVASAREGALPPPPAAEGEAGAAQDRPHSPAAAGPRCQRCWPGPARPGLIKRLLPTPRLCRFARAPRACCLARAFSLLRPPSRAGVTPRAGCSAPGGFPASCGCSRGLCGDICRWLFPEALVKSCNVSPA